ncbi:MAG: galactose-1-phosphate uridylyltransferase [Nanobdellota archaeon]
MTEFRKDYVLNQWVIISQKRGKRPHEFTSKPEKEKKEFCFFCPGNEDSTPPELGRVERDGNWIIRWFDNKFPAVEHSSHASFKNDGLFEYGPAFGHHEVIVEGPWHNKQLSDYEVPHIAEVLKVYTNRVRFLCRQRKCNYVSIFKNHGGSAGTSIKHSHSQVISLNKVPLTIERKSRDSMRGKKCVYCEVLQREMRSKRRIMATKSAVAFAPFASRYNWEAWIFPRRHICRLEELDSQEYHDIATIIKHVTTKLKRIGVAYNMFVHYAPKGSEMHMHIEICPRKAIHAGFELSTGFIINAVSPEDAAEFYRDA